MTRRLILTGSGLLFGAIAIMVAVGAPHWDSAQALTNCPTETAALNAAEETVFNDLNAYRQANGLAPVKLSPNLSRAAAFMTEDLLAKRYWSHFEPSGRSPFQRAFDCGYPSTNTGENLAMTWSAASVVPLFKTDPPHDRMMLMAQWKVVGIGQAGGYWAMDFGAVDDSGTVVIAGPSVTATPTITPTATASPTPTATPTPGPRDPSAYPIRRAMLQMVATE